MLWCEVETENFIFLCLLRSYYVLSVGATRGNWKRGRGKRDILLELAIPFSIRPATPFSQQQQLVLVFSFFGTPWTSLLRLLRAMSSSQQLPCSEVWALALQGLSSKLLRDQHQPAGTPSPKAWVLSSHRDILQFLRRSSTHFPSEVWILVLQAPHLHF